MKATILIALVATTLIVGCRSTPAPIAPRSSDKPASTVSATETPSFDAARWEAAPVGRHPFALARQLERDDVLIGMTMSQVGSLLGRFEAAAIPLDYTTGPAEVEYGLEPVGEAKRGAITIHFQDGIVERVSIREWGRK